MAPLTGDDDNRTGDFAELKTLVKSICAKTTTALRIGPEKAGLCS